MYNVKEECFVLTAVITCGVVHVVHTPTNALFINFGKSFKFTLKYTISLLHVSVFSDLHQGALSVPH
jgi:hypothetical protein